jgi:Ca2+-binding EF-hand superfamily protein
LKGLTGNNADDDNDGKVTITELLNYIQNEAQYEKGNNLQPSFKQNNIDNDFIISARQ